jgi:hypothetical protein
MISFSNINKQYGKQPVIGYFSQDVEEMQGDGGCRCPRLKMRTEKA